MTSEHPRARPPLPAGLRRFGGGATSPVRLVCFPWAGAGASAFRRVATHLPPGIEVLSVQYPGREDRWREPCLARMEPIVERVVAELGQLPPRPLVLFGHSMGAFVGFEVARVLEAEGRMPPAAVVVSGSGSPDSPETFIRSPAASGDDAFVSDLLALGGTPAGVLSCPEMLRMLLPVLRADYEVLNHYARRPEPPLSCRLVACASHDDGSVTPRTVRAWAAHTRGPYEEHWFDGDHFYLNARPHDLAARLGGWALAAREAGGAHRPCRGEGPGAPSSGEEANDGVTDSFS